MKSLIICTSIHQKNTKMVAQAIADVLKCQIKKPGEVDIASLKDYDLIGFGSGIYNFSHHRSLINLVNKINSNEHQKVFIFSTRAQFPISICHNKLKKNLKGKGFPVLGEYSCKGLISFGPAKLIGGINKGKPNNKDLDLARKFADKLKRSRLNSLNLKKV